MRVATAQSTTPTSVPAVTPPPSTRLVAAVVRGQRIAVPCPEWCVTDHAAHDLKSLENLSHDGESFSLLVPTFGGGTERALIARLSQWPFGASETGSRPYLSLEVTDDGEVANVEADAALAFADQLVAHAEQIRRLAGALS